MDGTEDSKVASVPNQNVVVVEVDSPPIIVSELRPNDVLLGRGAPIIKYVGNVKFRALIKSRKQEYMATRRRVEKDVIALSIINVIGKRNGRFLQRIRPSSRQASVSEGPSEGKPPSVWKIADRNIAAEKVKQALRDKDPSGPQDDEESSNRPPAMLAASTEAARRQDPSLLLSQPGVDALLSHLRRPVQSGRALLPPTMYPYPPQHHRFHERDAPFQMMPSSYQQRQNPSLATMIQQLERDRQIEAMLHTQPPSLFPTLDARGFFRGSSQPHWHGSLGDHSSGGITQQLLLEHRLRNQLLRERLADYRGIATSEDTELPDHEQRLDISSETASGAGVEAQGIARGNLKREADVEHDSTVDRGGNALDPETDSSSNDGKNDALKEYADLPFTQTSSSSPDEKK